MRAVVFLLLTLALPTLAGDIQFFSDEDEYLSRLPQSGGGTFDIFSTGPQPTFLDLGEVTVELTLAGGALIFGPGDLNLGFTTNFLSSGVQEGDNNIIIRVPGGAYSIGVQIAVPAQPPPNVSITARTVSGDTLTTNFRSLVVAFAGFGAENPIESIVISSEQDDRNTPIANLGDITFGQTPLSTSAPEAIPTLSVLSLVLLAGALLLVGIRSSLIR